MSPPLGPEPALGPISTQECQQRPLPGLGFRDAQFLLLPFGTLPPQSQAPHKGSDCPEPTLLGRTPSHPPATGETGPVEEHCGAGQQNAASGTSQPAPVQRHQPHAVPSPDRSHAANKPVLWSATRFYLPRTVESQGHMASVRRSRRQLRQSSAPELRREHAATFPAGAKPSPREPFAEQPRSALLSCPSLLAERLPPQVPPHPMSPPRTVARDPVHL